MRMSCNGCRVLRKGCSENCSIRPCLQWIKNPDSQGNATVFLAKFYGRAGLMNLINAGAEPFRPAIFRSLLYEACGRIVNPIYGSVGLMYSGSWELCQAAVEAVLKGAPIVQIPSETAASSPVPSLKAYDIRHVAKEEACAAASGAAVRDLHKVSKTTRPRFKRSAANNSGGVGEPKQKASSADAAQIDLDESAQVCNLRWRRCYPIGFQRAPSHESFGSQVSGPATVATGAGDGESRESESLFSGDTAEGSMVTSHAEPGKNDGSAEDSGEVDLDLTLGLEPLGHAATSRAVPHPVTDQPKQCNTTTTAWRMDTCTADLGLDLAA